MCVRAPARSVNPDTACWRFLLAPLAPIENLQAALTLAGSHNLGVAIAELDLTNWPARCTELPKHDLRAISRASRRPVRAIPASADLNCRRRGIEDRLERRTTSLMTVLGLGMVAMIFVILFGFIGGLKGTMLNAAGERNWVLLSLGATRLRALRRRRGT